MNNDKADELTKPEDELYSLAAGKAAYIVSLMYRTIAIVVKDI